jgi:indolepyruvate ferredoxin oxidoreductase alpha subunit
VIILDNSTTAMTGHQEHPGTGRNLSHEPTNKVVFEDLGRALGIPRVHVVDPRIGSPEFENVLDECLASGQLSLIIARRPCILIAKQLREYERCECAVAPTGGTNPELPQAAPAAAS